MKTPILCPMSFASNNIRDCFRADCPWWCGSEDEGCCSVKDLTLTLNMLLAVVADWDEEEDDNEEKPGLRVLPTENGEGKE